MSSDHQSAATPTSTPKSGNGSEVIIHNARIVASTTPGHDDYNWMHIKSGRILGIGRGASPVVTTATAGVEAVTMIDMAGRRILPGLHDAHIHVSYLGRSLLSVDVLATKSIAELQQRLRDFIAQEPSPKTTTTDSKAGMPGNVRWISGSGWDQQSLGRYPTRHDLDAVCNDRPIVLWRVCFHLCVVNTMALRLAGINKDTLDPTGGVIDREEDDSGEPNGILRESANGIISTMTKVDSNDERIEQYAAGLQRCLESGLTAVQTNDEDAWPIYAALHDQGRLPIRVYLTIMHEERKKEGRPTPKQQYVTKDGSESLLSCDRVKIFSDGCLGAHTAAMSTPYLPPPTDKTTAATATETAAAAISAHSEVKASSGDPPSPKTTGDSHSASCAHSTAGGHKPTLGVLIHEPDVLKRMIADAHNEGWRLEIHAIGDRAADHVIQSCEEAKITVKDRVVLTHCQFLRDDIITAMARIGAIANVQPQFVVTDWKWSDATVAPSLQPWAYAWRSLLGRGITVSGSSDAPVELPLPFKGMFDAIYRPILTSDALAAGLKEDKKDLIVGTEPQLQRWRSHECVTLPQALHMYTEAAAYAANVETKLGRLMVGYAADFVILNHDNDIWTNSLLLARPARELLYQSWVAGVRRL